MYKKGYICRVRDGSQINICEDPWNLGSPIRKVMTRRGNIVITKVSKLINVDNRTWDEYVINELFWPINAQHILSVMLALGMMEDFVSWHYNRNGIFLVRSTYHVEWEYLHG